MSEHPKGGPGEAPGISRWVQELLQGSVRQRQAAARSLSSLRPPPPAALVALAQALADRDPGVARAVTRTLQGLGPEAIQPLLGALKHPRLAVRNKACKFLAEFRPEPLNGFQDCDVEVCQAATAALLRILQDPVEERGVRKAAAQTLAALRPDVLVHRLVKELLCGESGSQGEAADRLGHLGPEAWGAIPTLTWSLRKDPSAKVREAAARALGHLGPLTPEVIPALIQALMDDNKTVARAAQDSLVQPHLAGTAVPELAERLRSHPEAGRMAAQALGRIGTPEAITSLLGSLREHPDAGVKCVIATSLGAIERAGPAVVGPLVEALNDESGAVREATVQGLIGMGEAAVAALTAALRHELPDIRWRAAATLERMTPSSWAALDALALALEDDDGRVQVHAAVALVKLFEANPLVRTACQQKRDQSPDAYVPENERALAVLAETVQRKVGQRQDRQQAVEALGRLGSEARSAFQILAEVLADPSEDRLVRGSAWWALQRIDPVESAKLKGP